MPVIKANKVDYIPRPIEAYQYQVDVLILERAQLIRKLENLMNETSIFLYEHGICGNFKTCIEKDRYFVNSLCKATCEAKRPDTAMK